MRIFKYALTMRRRHGTKPTTTLSITNRATDCDDNDNDNESNNFNVSVVAKAMAAS